MTERAPRLLFVPVSGEFGMGEYARCLTIARGAQRRWPLASIRFVLSRRAPYAASTPFPTTLLESSPTFHTAAVVEVIKDCRPDVVIFDNAGRTAQLRSAARLGARVVYISARRRQRNKAFRLAWMRVIDEHWIAYPRFIAGELRLLERVKLALLRRPVVRFLDVILPPSREAAGDGSTASGYVLIVPGGGTGHPGAGDAVAQFLDAARRLAASGADTVFVGPTPSTPHAAAEPVAAGAPHAAMAPGVAGAVGIATVAGAPGVEGAVGVATAPVAPAEPAARLRMAGVLPQSELAALMRGARLIVANGGSTLIQALACGRPCVAVPIARDQDARIRRCVGARVAVAARLDAAAIERAASGLLRDEAALAALAGRAAALELADGLEVALGALAGLVAAP